jgi:hypothetical protein
MFDSVDTPGCAVMGRGDVETPRSCEAPVTHAGLAFFEHPRPRTYLLFASARHADQLIAKGVAAARSR